MTYPRQLFALQLPKLQLSNLALWTGALLLAFAAAVPATAQVVEAAAFIDGMG